MNKRQARRKALDGTSDHEQYLIVLALCVARAMVAEGIVRTDYFSQNSTRVSTTLSTLDDLIEQLGEPTGWKDCYRTDPRRVLAEDTYEKQEARRRQRENGGGDDLLPSREQDTTQLHLIARLLDVHLQRTTQQEADEVPAAFEACEFDTAWMDEAAWL